MARVVLVIRYFLCIATNLQISAGKPLPGPKGIQLCIQSCQSIRGCETVAFSSQQLRCDVSPEQDVMLPDVKQFNVAAMEKDCIRNCQVTFRRIITRKGECKCASRGITSFKLTRHGSGKTQAFTVPGSSGKKGKQFSRRVLTVGLTKASTENRPASAMYVLDLSSYKWEIIGQFKGKVVSLDFCGNVLYRCQSDPPGLYKTHMYAGKFDIASEERKSLWPCYDVAVIPRQMMFIRKIALWGFNAVGKIKFVLRVTNGQSGDRIAADRRELVFYLYSRVKSIIRKINMRGTQLLLFTISDQIRDLVILHSPAETRFLYTDMEDKRELTVGRLRRNATSGLKTIKRFHWRDISAFALTGNDLLLANKR